MSRKKAVLEKAQEIIREGNKPNAVRIADELDYSEADVHRCLNSLEKKNKVESYRKQVFGSEYRFIGVKR